MNHRRKENGEDERTSCCYGHLSIKLFALIGQHESRGRDGTFPKSSKTPSGTGSIVGADIALEGQAYGSNIKIMICELG